MRVIACMALLLCLALPAPAEAGRANVGVGGAGNPLEGVRFPAYVPPTKDPAYDALAAYQATDPAPELAAVLAKPRFRWFGPWVPNTVIKRTVRDFIGTVQQGDAEAGVQIAAFRLVPWGDAACRKLPSPGQRRAYGRWIHELQYALGRTRAVLVLQPDMPFVRCVPRHSSWAVEDVAWAARELAELERATVYIDSGAADWVPVNQMADILRRAGIRHVRGFALDVTRFHSTRRQLDYGRRLLNRLKRFGIHRKGFIVNTAQNGRPFTPERAGDVSERTGLRRRPRLALRGVRPAADYPHRLQGRRRAAVGGASGSGRPSPAWPRRADRHDPKLALLLEPMPVELEHRGPRDRRP